MCDSLEIEVEIGTYLGENDVIRYVVTDIRN